MIGHYEVSSTLPPIEKIDAIATVLGIKAAQLLEDASLDEKTDSVADIDSRSIKKLRDILSLSSEDRNDLYRILNKMLRKNQLEKANQSKPAEQSTS